MKSFKLVFFLLTFLLLNVSMYAQNKTKEQERKENKVDTLYTMEERANIGLWAFNEVQKMNLDEETEDEYFRIAFKYTYRISRLNDKDQTYTSEERKQEFNKLISQLDSELKEVLDDQQFQMHRDFFIQLERSVYNRYGWEWDKD